MFIYGYSPQRWAPPRLLLGALLLLGLVIGLTPTPAHTQSNSLTYWQYDATGQITLLELADLNDDGIEEFIVVTDGHKLITLSSGGQPLWSNPYTAAERILHVDTVRHNSPQPRGRSLALATGSHLILLDDQGNPQWSRLMPVTPTGLLTFDYNQDGQDEILISLNSGQLRLYSQNGQMLWQYTGNALASLQSNALIQVGDVNRDGAVEIAFSYFTASGYSELALLNGQGAAIWDRAMEGQITALTFTDFDPDQPLHVAAGTSRGRVHLIDSQRNTERWFRTTNKPITALAMATLDEIPHLIAGTAVGRLFAYSSSGRPTWTSQLSPTPDRSIVAISANPTNQPQPIALAVTLASNQPRPSNPITENTLPPPPLVAGQTEDLPGDINEPLEAVPIIPTREVESASTALLFTPPELTQLLLLSQDGRVLRADFPTGATIGLTRLIDINKDGREELLLARFSTLELLDPGFGPGRNIEAWNYRLDSRPQTALILDVERDGRQSLLVGTQGGILSLIQSQDGSRRWSTDVGGIIRQAALIDTEGKPQPSLAIIYNQSKTSPSGQQSFTGHIQLLNPVNGQPEPGWEEGVQLPIVLASLLITDITQDGRAEILVGTIDGQILAYSIFGQQLWQTSLTGRIDQLAAYDSGRNTPQELTAVAQSNLLYFLSHKGVAKAQLAYLPDIISLQVVPPELSPPTHLIVTGQDGIVYGLGSEGRPLWEYDSQSTPIAIFFGGNSLFIATEEEQLIRLAFLGPGAPTEMWRLANLGRISAFYWGDLNGDIVPDIAIGNRSGVISLYSADGQQMWDQVQVPGELFMLTAMQRQVDQPAELVAITEAGVVRLFQKQVNRPPLLFNPQAETEGTGYSLSVSVINTEENETVRVRLDLFDPVANSWISKGERQTRRSEALFWLVDPPVTSEGVRYRFYYYDDVHAGMIEPAPGPPPQLLIPPPENNAPMLIAFAGGVAALGLGGMIVRHAWQPDVRARRFYRRLEKQPAATLNMIRVAYNLNADTPGFLLTLANQARLHGNRPLAGLVDGLFLLADRPEAGLPIILTALREAKQSGLNWQDYRWWEVTFQTAQQLFAAPTITELSLLRPQLEEALRLRGRAERPAISLDALLPILTRCSDSERVDAAGDRLVYLNEAENLLHQLGGRITWQLNHIEKSLVNAISKRWLGLVTAAIEAIHGQASLEIRLKTRRIVAAAESEVTLEIKNSGRAPAENITISLGHSPAFTLKTEPQLIPFLPAGRGRQINFTIAPLVTDRFRLVCHLEYDDRHRPHKSLEFADMVHLLPPVREFTPVVNPYSPGTPLRRHSPLFVGRDRFFRFIAQNAVHPEQNRVLIMVGQRRTGKTSALLRLDQYLPEHLLAVYIDCQSLGVVEGMAALLFDLAWAMSDALAARGIEVEVPERPAWDANPTHLFERQFIPCVQSLLPAGTILLLVLDEFEALQNLVDDGILPPTFFTYLRHLMQHAQGLSFVFVGTHRLEEMSSDYWSVLFNIALHGEIGFLDDAAATRLITEPVSPHLVYDDLALEKILRVTAGHPYFLQLVCYTLVNRANEQKNPYITISDVNATLDQMLSLGEAHFAYLWQQSSPAERTVLNAAAQLMDRERPFHPADLLHYLDKFNLTLTPAEMTLALNRLVQRDILREVGGDELTTLYELKIGLVGLWVARNKSVSKLYERNGTTAQKRTPKVRVVNG